MGAYPSLPRCNFVDSRNPSTTSQSQWHNTMVDQSQPGCLAPRAGPSISPSSQQVCPPSQGLGGTFMRQVGIGIAEE